MIAKRILAIAVALALIVGAWVVRTEVIDDDGEASAEQPADPSLLLCLDELDDICNAIGDALDLTLVFQSAGDTIDTLGTPGAEPALWLTFEGFPDMVNTARLARGGEPITYSATALASSPLAAIGVEGRLTSLVDVCGDPVDLGCLGAQRDLKRSVSSIDSAIGLLSVSAAIAAQTGNAFSAEDPELHTWARSFQRSSATISLSGGTAVGTLQTRPTADVALGVEAEIAPSRVGQFDVLYAEPMVRANVVLVTPGGLDEPTELQAILADALTERGWEAPARSEPGALPSPGQMLSIREFWKTL